MRIASGCAANVMSVVPTNRNYSTPWRSARDVRSPSLIDCRGSLSLELRGGGPFSTAQRAGHKLRRFQGGAPTTSIRMVSAHWNCSRSMVDRVPVSPSHSGNSPALSTSTCIVLSPNMCGVIASVLTMGVDQAPPSRSLKCYSRMISPNCADRIYDITLLPDPPSGQAAPPHRPVHFRLRPAAVSERATHRLGVGKRIQKQVAVCPPAPASGG